MAWPPPTRLRADARSLLSEYSHLPGRGGATDPDATEVHTLAPTASSNRNLVDSSGPLFAVEDRGDTAPLEVIDVEAHEPADRENEASNSLCSDGIWDDGDCEP